jgi:hypothetical protein
VRRQDALFELDRWYETLACAACWDPKDCLRHTGWVTSAWSTRSIISWHRKSAPSSWWERRTSVVIFKRLDGYEATARRPVSAVLSRTERTYLDSLEENAFD